MHTQSYCHIRNFFISFALLIIMSHCDEKKLGFMYNKMEMRCDILKRCELLSPAGSYESAVAAIQNGCDALYLAGMRFGARAYATNFNEENLEQVIAYAHAYQVKVYVTLNTLIHDEEIEDCIAYVDFLYHAGADALIVQDLGIVEQLQEHYPDFEIHASTQMHTVNQDALLFLKENGIPRAVLAREVTIDEIQSFAKLGIDLEVFVHGALCVCYSGQCLMSSMIGNRSGNRGECAQPCRMPYSLFDYENQRELKKNTYLLSLKDLNTLDRIPELMNAGISSFKIEGRMKKSEYVALMTRLYKKRINGEEITEEELKNAKILFHRGYTEGFLYQKKGSELGSFYRPNHIGIPLGKVMDVKNGRMKLRLENDLHQGDGIRVLMEKKDYGFSVNMLYIDRLLQNFAPAGSMVEVKINERVEKGALVVKTSDPLLEKEIASSYNANPQRRVGITMTFHAECNQVMRLTLDDGIHCICVQSKNRIEKAMNRATTKNEVEKQLSKLNDTIFRLDRITITMTDDLFIPVKMMNQLRRDGVEQLYHLRSKEVIRKSKVLKKAATVPEWKLDFSLSAKVQKEEQLLAVLDDVDVVYVEDEQLYHTYKQYEKVKLCAHRVMKHGYADVSMIEDIGGIHALDDFECGTSLNVYNAHTAHFLHQRGASLVSVSNELRVDEIITLKTNYERCYGETPALLCVVYGRVEVMVSEHCPINAALLDNNKEHCTLCRNKVYALKDKFGNLYPMNNDRECRMHLLDCKIMNRIDEMLVLKEHNISAFRLDFTMETEKEVKEIIQDVKSLLKSS